MATVYLGRLSGPMGFQRPVAIKLMRPEYVQSDDFVKMFLDEARLVARLSHPNVVQLLELGQDDGPIGNSHGGFFIVMECLMGESLLDTWYACQDRQLMLPYDMIAWIGARAAEGLHHAHELRDSGTGAFERIVHRDVNPGNVFLTYEGQVKVIDFGVAKALNRLSSTTSFGTLKGKVAYMAPEQAKTADVDRRADVFSLGVTLWELTTDRRLFKRKNDVDTLIAVTTTNVPDPSAVDPGYPADLWHVLQRALHRDREARYPTALDFSRELDRFAQSQGRTVDATTLAEVMHYLFWEQRNRFFEWLKQASAGEQSEVLRSSASKKQFGMASVDVAPLSRRAGSAVPIRGSMPSIETAQEQNLNQTIPLSQPSPMMMPIQNAPIRLPPEIVRASQAPPKSSAMSNVIFFIIAAIGVLCIGGYFAYSRFRPSSKPAPTATVPAPSASATTSSSPPEVDSGALVIDFPETMDAGEDAQDSAPADTGVTTTFTPRAPKDSGVVSDDVLLHRR
jgi:serine/threonine-protein kinase